MPDDRDKNPLVQRPAFEEILGNSAGQLRQKIQKAGGEPAANLLTSRDLFGEIIQALDEPAIEVPAPRTPSPPISHDTAPGDDAPRPRGAASLPVREDTVSVDTSPEVNAAAPSDSAPAEQYGLLDLAYSTLLKDPRLQHDLERLEEGEAPNFGDYLLLDRVASGGMAEVFRAKRKGVDGFEKIVALKRILPHLSSNKDFVEMFIDEAKMVAGLSHPNIVQIFDLGKIQDTYYIAMEYVDGRDLRTILARAREKDVKLGADLAALIVGRVGSALEYAHRQRDALGNELRIVHRDVSPQNILISNEGEVKLVDFGIAKAAIKASHTDSGSLRGKLLYMSPEQAWGRAVDKRSDVYSLGLVLFEMLTGRCLFTGSSEMSILERVREARVIPPSSLNPAVPIELEVVITRALRKNPDERYQDASEMLRDLDSYLRRRPFVGAADLARFVNELF